MLYFYFDYCRKIINPEPIFFDEKTCADIRFDCGGALIAPGFIDVQINGIM
jgi:N-acetylglucosamine-6-phosphate deacetylase